MRRVIALLISLGGTLLLAGAQSENQGPQRFHELLFKTAWKIENNDTWRDAFERLVLTTTENKPLDVEPFDCREEETNDVPTTVHALRPGDVKIIAALGDSITAGNAIGAKTVLTVLREHRGEAWSIGGDKSLEDGVITLPNILKKFNPAIRGYSTGYGSESSANTYMNVAVPGAKAEDLSAEADHLIQKLQRDPSIDITRDWKVITVMIGSGDMCDYCKDRERYSAGVFIAHVQTTLDKLHMALPRTLVNLVPMADVTPIPRIKKDWLCDIINWAMCTCATDPLTRDEVSAYQDALYQGLRALVESGRYDSTFDFTVVLQPFLVDIEFPKDAEGLYDEKYISPDCFHPARLAHQAAAYMLWNTMMLPVGQKPNAYPIYAEKTHRFTCPSSEHPYIYTSGNSAVGGHGRIYMLPDLTLGRGTPDVSSVLGVGPPGRVKRDIASSGATGKHSIKRSQTQPFADDIQQLRASFDHDIKTLRDNLALKSITLPKLPDVELSNISSILDGVGLMGERFPDVNTSDVFADAVAKAEAALQSGNDTLGKVQEEIVRAGNRAHQTETAFADKLQSVNETVDKIMAGERDSENSTEKIVETIAREILKPMSNLQDKAINRPSRYRREVTKETKPKRPINEVGVDAPNAPRNLTDILNPQNIHAKFEELGKQILDLKKNYEKAMGKARVYVQIRKALDQKVTSEEERARTNKRPKRHATQNIQPTVRNNHPNFTETMKDMHDALDMKNVENTFGDMWKVLSDVQKKVSFGMKKINEGMHNAKGNESDAALKTPPLVRSKRAASKDTKSEVSPLEKLFGDSGGGLVGGMGTFWKNIRKAFDPATIKENLDGLAREISVTEMGFDRGIKELEVHKRSSNTSPVGDDIKEGIRGSSSNKGHLRHKRAAQNPQDVSKYDPKKFDKLMDTIHPEKLDKLHKLTQGIFDQSQKFGDELKYFGSKMQNPLTNVLPPVPPIFIPGMQPKPLPKLKPIKKPPTWPLPVKPIRRPKLENLRKLPNMP